MRWVVGQRKEPKLNEGGGGGADTFKSTMASDVGDGLTSIKEFQLMGP